MRPKSPGHQPAIHDRLRRHLRVIEILRHQRFAAHRHFADALGVWIHDFYFHAGQWLSNGVRAKRLEIIQGDRRSRFGAAVSVPNWNSKIIKKLQGGRLSKSSTHKKRAQLAAKRLVNLRQQRPA